MIKKLLSLLLICSFASCLTGCDEKKTVRKFREASAKLKINAIKIVEANIDAFKAGEITKEDLARLNTATGKFKDAVKDFDDALAAVSTDGPVLKTTLDRLQQILDERVVAAFFDLLETLNLFPGANTETVKTIIATIRLTILAIQAATSEVYKQEGYGYVYA